MKRLATLAGSALAILAMTYVIYFHGHGLIDMELRSGVVPYLAGAIGLYVAVILIAARNWKMFLEVFGADPRQWNAERGLLVSQVGKYVPGNVAHYLGRAALAMKDGVPAKLIGMALLTETSATLAGGFLAAALSLAIAPDLAGLRDQLPSTLSGSAWLGACALSFLLLLITAAFLRRRIGRFSNWPEVDLRRLPLAILLYAVSFVMLGVSLHLVAGVVSPAQLPMSVAVAVFGAAWIAGLVTPGAPGGLGVREAIIALGLAPFLGGGAALSAALIHRGVSVVGDMVSFGLGLLLPRTPDGEGAAAN